LAGALKIWWDQSQERSKNNEPDWKPALLPSIFFGAKAAAMNINVDPNQVGMPDFTNPLLLVGHVRIARQVTPLSCVQDIV